jgi:hypothetical protein
MRHYATEDSHPHGGWAAHAPRWPTTDTPQRGRVATDGGDERARREESAIRSRSNFVAVGDVAPPVGGTSVSRPHHGEARGAAYRARWRDADARLSSLPLVSALLFSGSLRKLLEVDAGFRQNGILIVDLDFSRLKILVSQRVAFKRDMVQRLRALPGRPTFCH